MTSTANTNSTDDSKSNDAVRVLITGAAGQIGYSLLPLFCSGQVFGSEQKVILHLLEITPVLPALNGVRMELDDCAYPLVQQIVCTDDAQVAFKDIDYAVLVGGFPRRKGMVRADLLNKNAPIFTAMGSGLEKYAKTTCKVLVVANPANTNCLIAANNAPKIPKKNFCAMTRLDMNRARNQIALKMGVAVTSVKNITIWGNHSKTQVPDISYATVNGKAVSESLDPKYVAEEFVPLVQTRGKAIIDARGFSSAMSAANAAKDCVRDWVAGSNGEYVAMAVESDGSYGVPKGIFYSFPCVCAGGSYEIVQGLKVSDGITALMKVSADELIEERDIACGTGSK